MLDPVPGLRPALDALPLSLAALPSAPSPSPSRVLRRRAARRLDAPAGAADAAPGDPDAGSPDSTHPTPAAEPRRPIGSPTRGADGPRPIRGRSTALLAETGLFAPATG